MRKSSPAVGYIVGALIFPVVGFVMALFYLFVMRMVGGARQGMDGLALAASIFAFPMLALFFAAVGWAPLTMYLEKAGRASIAKIALYCFLLALVMSLVVAGASGFRVRGGAPLFNYFVPAICAIGAAAATWVRRRIA